MGRRSLDERGEDSGEFERPARKKPVSSNSVALWLIVAIGGGILLLCGGVTALGLVMWYGAASVQPTGKTYKREELRTMLVGKKPDEVKAMLGPPDSTDDNGTGSFWWTYRYRSVDPVNGKTDSTTFVKFRDGVVKEVSF